MAEIKLGDFVTDSVTGFSGVVLARVEYLNGCVRCEVQSKKLHEGKPIESCFFDEQRLNPESTVTTGGPPSKEAPRS